MQSDAPGALQAYYDIFTKIPTLSRDAERECLLRIKDGDEDAFHAFILANMRLVISRATKFAPKNDPRIMDFVSDGTLGLLRAIELFDCDRNLRFSTYAVGWIESYIRKSIHFFQKETQSTISNLRKKFKHAESLLRTATGEDPTDEEVALFLRWPDYLLAAYSRYSDPKIRVAHGSLLLDSTPSDTPEPSIAPANDELIDVFADLLRNLTPLEEDILRRHYGIDCPEETYKTLAAFYGLSRERVRQLEDTALRKLFVILKEKEIPLENFPFPERDSDH